MVNHSVGFVNAQGAHTNKIETLWSHLKHAYRKRGGINKRRIDFFKMNGNGGNEISKIATTRRIGLNYIDHKVFRFKFFCS